MVPITLHIHPPALKTDPLMVEKGQTFWNKYPKISEENSDLFALPMLSLDASS